MIRPLGTAEQEFARRECERRLVGKSVWLSDRSWVIRVVDHLAGDACLVEWSGPLPGLEHLHPCVLKHVRLEDFADQTVCFCGQHAREAVLGG